MTLRLPPHKVNLDDWCSTILFLLLYLPESVNFSISLRISTDLPFWLLPQIAATMAGVPHGGMPPFFFLQCRTSTRHGRSTTGNCKDCFRKSPWKQNPRQKQHPHNQTNTNTTQKNNTHTKGQATARQYDQGNL